MKSLQIPSVEISSHDQMCWDRVITKAKKRELEVLYAFADGLSPQQVAKRLSISIKTVDMYKTRLLALCHNEWNIPFDERLDYHFLHKFVKAEGKSAGGMQSMIQGNQLQYLADIPSTKKLLHSQLGELSIQERVYRSQVIAEAKKRELEVLYAFADGLNPRQVADRLGISVKTVDTYKTKLLALCRSAWNLSPDEWLDYRFLNKKFANFSSYAQRKTPGEIR